MNPFARVKTALWIASLAAVAMTADAATLTLRIRPTWKGATISADAGGLHLPDGEAVSVSRLALLVSGGRLRIDGGGWTNAEPSAAFLNPLEGRSTLVWTNTPDAGVLAVEFQIGLPPALNHADAGAFPAGHPLNPAVNNLHWSWQGGYIFLALEGRRANAGGDDSAGFAYHLATDRRITTITLPAAFDLHRDTEASFDFDVARLFDAVVPISLAEAGGASTHSAAGDTVADRLQANLVRAWRFTGARPTAPPGPLVAAAPASKAAAGVTPWPWRTPAGFPRPALPLDNPLTEEGVALGKRLFFDPTLSRTGAQSCAGCHNPDAGFADAGRRVSIGAAGVAGARNASALSNLAWHESYFWDGRAPNLREQAVQPIQNPTEMGESMDRVVAKLSASPVYPPLFAAAFANPAVSSESVGLALEQYLLTLVDADSRFDKWLLGEAVLTSEERRGLELFTTEYDPARGRFGADCFHCHGGRLFSDFAFHNNGLDADSPADMGRAAVTGRAADSGKFKTPSLRNVAVTGPYMHDGRFATLDEVVAHYDHGVRRSPALDPNLAKHPESGLGLSPADRRALVAFLVTLTDRKWLRAPETAAR
jgi:cytochrome c peroxidase